MENQIPPLEVKTNVWYELENVAGKTITFDTLTVPQNLSCNNFRLNWKVTQPAGEHNGEKLFHERSHSYPCHVSQYQKHVFMAGIESQPIPVSIDNISTECKLFFEVHSEIVKESVDANVTYSIN